MKTKTSLLVVSLLFSQASAVQVQSKKLGLAQAKAKVSSKAHSKLQSKTKLKIKSSSKIDTDCQADGTCAPEAVAQINSASKIDADCQADGTCAPEAAAQVKQTSKIQSMAQSKAKSKLSLKSSAKISSNAQLKTQTEALTGLWSKAKTMAHAGLWSRSKASVIDCEDQDGVDSYGDGCDWYDSNVAECGNYDTEDFAATDACCSCMIQHEEVQSEIYTCSDDLTVTDSFGDGCGWYDDNPGGCGEYDTDEFIAANACVSCGACDVSPSSCGDDLTVVDSYGDNCTWYNENQGECGEYDTASFVAEDACVACGACSGCVNGTGVDSYGDGCEWYATNQSECGNYDTEDFQAYLQCCSCQDIDPVTPEDQQAHGYENYTMSDYGYGTGGNFTYAYDGCTNDNSIGDVDGDTCETWYDANPDTCGDYDTETFVSAHLCCACVGTPVDHYETQAVVYEGCANDDSIGDSYGDSCTAWYDANPDTCGEYDTIDFVSTDLCCACM